MIITMSGDSTSADQQFVVRHLQERGYQTHTLSGGGDVVIGVNGRPVVNGLVEEVTTFIKKVRTNPNLRFRDSSES